MIFRLALFVFGTAIGLVLSAPVDPLFYLVTVYGGWCFALGLWAARI